jgi:hypothetical protein
VEIERELKNENKEEKIGGWNGKRETLDEETCRQWKRNRNNKRLEEEMGSGGDIRRLRYRKRGRLDVRRGRGRGTEREMKREREVRTSEESRGTREDGRETR